MSIIKDGPKAGTLYVRKILSDKSLNDLKVLEKEIKDRFKGLELDRVGIYLDGSSNAVYGLYVRGYMLKGSNIDELIREIEIYERFSDKL